MARTAKAVVEEVFENTSVDMTEKTNEEVKKNSKKVVKEEIEELRDSDEIKVVSLVPNVSYKDSKTLDMYEWDEIGHIEYMTFETLKNMWRNSKGYFKNMWLKPEDDRVINKFGLTKTFEKYEYLMDSSNYTKKSIKSICEAISDTPNGLKFSICDKVKNLVIDGELTDIGVIRELEKRLKIELTEFLD